MVGFGFLSFLPTYKLLDSQPYEFSNRQAAENFYFTFCCVHILSLLNFQFSKLSIFQTFCQTFTLTNLELYNFSNCQISNPPNSRTSEFSIFQIFKFSLFYPSISTFQFFTFSTLQILVSFLYTVANQRIKRSSTKILVCYYI